MQKQVKKPNTYYLFSRGEFIEDYVAYKDSLAMKQFLAWKFSASESPYVLKYNPNTNKYKMLNYVRHRDD